MSQYYNRFNPTAPFDTIRFRADKVLQSAELNELQSAADHRLRGIADALFKDGDVIRDARIIVDPDSGTTHCESGAIYLAGCMRGVPEANLVIPAVGIVNVGIYLNGSILSELDDPALLNPAVGTRGYMEPGAERLLITPTWGFSGDGQSGDFYPVWVVEDGYVRAKEPPPNLDAVTQALARYDRDSAGGTYVVSGLQVAQAADLSTGEQVYTISEGRARVVGYAIEQAAGRRVVYNAQPELRYIDAEPHASASVELQRINLGRHPAQSITQVRITARKTVTLTHGGFAGAADPLPDTSVIMVESIKQGGTSYTSGTSWVLTAGQIDWSPTGPEPAPGSSYQVTYQHIANIEPVEPDSTGFSVAGALPGTLVLVSYTQMLRRIDRLCLGADGTYQWIKGVPAEWSPHPPAVPADVLPLASVYQSWDDERRLIADGVRMVSMAAIAGYENRMDRITEDLAELRLSVDVSGRMSGIKKGLFADPFLSDAGRDAGIAQTGVVSGGGLGLPIAVMVHQLGLDITSPLAPTHGYSAVLEQTMRTGTMLINPYMAFRPLPARTTLSPAIDRWTVYQYLPNQTLRQISVQFNLQGFVPNETLSSVSFDGISVTPAPLSGGTLVANASGALNGKFTIPAGVPLGTKEVVFVGTGGSHGEAFFTGESILYVPPPPPPTPPSNGDNDNNIVFGPSDSGSSNNKSSPCAGKFVIGPSTDPLAQTFTLPSTCQLAGVDLWFTAKSTEVVVQIREAQLGMPTNNILIERRVRPAEIVTTGPTRITWAPTAFTAGREYALVVLCDDAVTALAIAELGKTDANSGRWVTSQPYQVGVLLSSSNANTWTAHQDRDLAFRLLAADYSATERIVDLGTVDLTGATDLMVLGYAERPSAAAEVSYEITVGEHSVTLADGQQVWLAAPVVGSAHIRARLRGNAKAAAVLYPGVQLVEGHIAHEGTYISPTVNAGADSTVRVIYEAGLSGGAAVRVHYQEDASGAPWVEVPYLSASAPTAGIREITHELAHINAERLRVRLTLVGHTTARPYVTNLRVVVL